MQCFGGKLRARGREGRALLVHEAIVTGALHNIAGRRLFPLEFCTSRISASSTMGIHADTMTVADYACVSHRGRSVDDEPHILPLWSRCNQ